MSMSPELVKDIMSMPRQGYSPALPPPTGHWVAAPEIDAAGACFVAFLWVGRPAVTKSIDSLYNGWGQIDGNPRGDRVLRYLERISGGGGGGVFVELFLLLRHRRVHDRVDGHSKTEAGAGRSCRDPAVTWSIEWIWGG